MKKTIITLVALTSALSVFAMRSTNTVTGTVDTRDYILTVTSPYGEVVYPEGGVSTNSWHSMVYSGATGSPEYESSGTTLHSLFGFSGEGIDPASGAGESAYVKLTNVTSTLTWSWNNVYRVTWTAYGFGEIQPINMAYSGSGAWCTEGVTNHLRAVAGYGWLFTEWSGDATGGPSASNLYFAATAPMSLVASFSDDPDGDGLKNTNEWAVGANPWMADTDGDDFDDLFEFNNGLSPIRDSSAFLTHIQDNPETYGLYESNAVLDVAVGQVALKIDGTTARLSLQVEQSGDLVTWTNAGAAIEWSMPVDDEKAFMRVRSSAAE